MSERNSLTSQRLTWVNIVNAAKEDIDYLQKKFKFFSVDLEDSYAHKHAQRPKLIFRPNYFFMVLLFPVYNPRTKTISSTEVDFFVTKDHIITLHYNQTRLLQHFFDELAGDKQKRDSYLAETPAMFIYELLHKIYISKYPLLDDISARINTIEKNIFAGKERQMLEDILQVKRNVVYAKKVMLGHKNILKDMIAHRSFYWKDKENTKMFYDNLISHVKDMWATLENYLETINALEDTNSTLVSFRINDIMRTLTIFSVIVFPLTLMAAIFGMNTSYIPLVGLKHDFWIIIGLMLVATIAMYAYFKKKRWI